MICYRKSCISENFAKLATLPNFYLAVDLYMSPIYIPSLRPIIFSVYGIINWCPIDRIQVASNSAIIPAIYWPLRYSILIRMIQYPFQDGSKNLNLRKIEPTPNSQSRFHLDHTLPQMKKQVFSLNGVRCTSCNQLLPILTATNK